MKQIIVTIGDDGNPTVETKGFSGAECIRETAALETGLGKIVASRTTPEFNQAATVQQKAKALA